MRLKLLKHNLHQVVVVFDQLIGCLIGTLIGLCNGTHRVYADETISAYLWRQHKYWYINIFRILVDALFFIFTWKWDHCKRSFESEQNSEHLPQDEW